MNKHKLCSQYGAVSMITVLFVTIIFTVLVLGFVRIMISEQRQATDDDLSSRAFYAAESGVEDAKAALADYMMEGGEFDGAIVDQLDDCEPFGEPFLIDEPTLATEITCQTVETELPYVEIGSSSFRAWHNLVLPLRSNNNFDTFQLQWHMPERDWAGYNLRGGSKQLPRTTSWTGGSYPAALKMTIMARPTSGVAPEVEDLIQDTRVVHMLPGGPGGENSFTITDNDFGIGGASSLPSVRCSNEGDISSGQFACGVEFDGLDPANNEYFIALTPLYRSTTMRLSLSNGNNPVDIVDVQAEVDVTARAGDVFRRVQARILLADPSLALIPDLAVGSNEICKNYQLRKDPNEPDHSFPTVNGPGVLDNYCVN